MSLLEAVEIFLNIFPGYKIVGYWKINNEYILNVKPLLKKETPLLPGQYIVKSNGTVHAVNPMNININLENMIKIKY